MPDVELFLANLHIAFVCFKKKKKISLSLAKFDSDLAAKQWITKLFKSLKVSQVFHNIWPEQKGSVANFSTFLKSLFKNRD